MKKFISFLLTLVCVGVFAVMPYVYATGFGDTIEPTGPSDTTLNTPIAKVLGAIRWAGYIVAVGLIIYIGIKYLMASAAEKADLKGLLIKYVVGAGLIVFGTQIASWIFSIGNNG